MSENIRKGPEENLPLVPQEQELVLRQQEEQQLPEKIHEITEVTPENPLQVKREIDALKAKIDLAYDESLGIQSKGEVLETAVELLDKEVVEKVEKLPLDSMERANILLTLTREKPASIIGFEMRYGEDGTPDFDDEEYYELFDKTDATALLFDELKLPYVVKYADVININNKSKTGNKIPQILYGQDKESLRKLEKAKTDGQLGRALGFPETAVRAVENHRNTIRQSDLPDDIKNGEAIRILNFALSQDNWREEFKTVERWAEVVKANSPEIFDDLGNYTSGEDLLLEESDE